MTTSRLAGFSKLRVAVVGDLIADHYLNAQPRRLSREAPVMVMRYVSEAIGAGGAANVARNLRALGSAVRLLGVVGDDQQGGELVRLLDEDSVDTSGVRFLAGYETPTKTRVLAAQSRRSAHQVLRIDREPEHAIEPSARAAIACELASAGRGADAVIVSDYEYGLSGIEIAAVARELAGAGKIVVLDPRCDIDQYTGITALTPNVDEVARFTNTPADRLDDPCELRRAAASLLQVVRCRLLLVTRGNLGMALFGEDLPAEGVLVDAVGTGDDVTDVCGAGDTATAVFTLALAAGHRPPDAMKLANAASGVVVLKPGAAVCSASEVESALCSVSKSG